MLAQINARQSPIQYALPFRDGGVALSALVFRPCHLSLACTFSPRCIVEPEIYLTDDYLESGKTRTFKPRKDVPEGTKQYQLRKYAEATLVG